MKLPRYQQIRKVPGQPHPTAASAASSGQQPFHGDIFINGRPMQSMTADLDIGPLPGVAPGSREKGQRPFPYSARGSRASRAATASRGERRPSMTASTARLMGRSTPSAWARATTAGQQATPSAT